MKNEKTIIRRNFEGKYYAQTEQGEDVLDGFFEDEESIDNALKEIGIYEASFEA